jgi:release factor glutamine methyltransferase
MKLPQSATRNPQSAIRNSLPPASATLAQILAWAASELAAADLASPRLDAEVLLAHSLSTNRAGLYARLHTMLSLPQIAAFQQRLHRRLQHEPVQYITGTQEFWSLEFMVDPRVLIPRPETELVVETALQLLNFEAGHRFSPHPNPLPKGAREFSGKILDVGTGSGCIAIALATELPTAEIWATDISLDALAVATTNAQRHNVYERIHFLQGSLFGPVAPQEHPFGLIVSNPPYIACNDLLTLQPEVKDWEPRHALDGGRDGLDLCRQLLNEAPRYLSPDGWLVLEIGDGQDVEILSSLQESTGFADNFCIPDYAGRGRVIAAQKK